MCVGREGGSGVAYVISNRELLRSALLNHAQTFCIKHRLVMHLFSMWNCIFECEYEWIDCVSIKLHDVDAVEDAVQRISVNINERFS